MFGLNGISTLDAPHNAIAKSVQRLKVKVIRNQGEIAMPTISADTYRLSIQVPESWLIPSAPRMAGSAIDVSWSLNSDTIAAIRTPQRPSRGLISTESATSLSYGIGSGPGTSLILLVHTPEPRIDPRRGKTTSTERMDGIA